jgi:hypothetical protein
MGTVCIRTGREAMNHLVNTTPKKGSIIRCECGFEIPLIPDGHAVGVAIDAHIEEHRKKHKDPKKAQEVANHIQEYLFTSLVEKIDEK